MEADTRNGGLRTPGRGRTESSRSYDEEGEMDEAMAMAMASQAAKLTPELRKILTGAHEKRKREEEESSYRVVEPSSLGDDPLRQGSYEDANEKGQSGARETDHASDHIEKQEYMASEAYKPNAFGDFRSYMKNKRLKLKVQEMSMTDDEARAHALSSKEEYPPYFTGTNIYINGHTNPPYAELRRLIHLHNGELMPYLDTKSPVTHIIASNLTAKKRIEFKDYRVVRPEWITQSIAQGRRLDWRDFRCSEDASGAMTAGALAGQSVVGQQEAEQEAIRARQEIEAARAAAARGDWRSSSKASESMSSASSAAEQLRAYGQSGFGAGTENGVGPWGKASRQRTLGGWARKDRHLEEDGEKTANGETMADADESVPRKQSIIELTPETTETVSVVVGQHKLEEHTEGADGNPPLDQDKDDPNVIRDTAVHILEPKTPRRKKEVPDKIFPSIGTDPVSEIAAIAAGQQDARHPYAARPSNSKAAQLMASPSWRERNTATSDGFLQGYFTKSRLHHLSTWKSEMRELVAQALREAKKEEGSVDLPDGVRRVIFHIDFDAFFVSVGLRHRPDLRERAVVVCHADSDTSGNASTSEIASCNYIARTHGIRNGMSLGQARRYCADVQTIPYDFTAYNDIAIQFYTLLLSHADAIEAVSIDEALIDVSFLLDEMRKNVRASDSAREALMNAYTGHQSSQGIAWTEEKQLAEALRDQIRDMCGCEASIGIGANVLLARLATRKAKPAGSFHLCNENIPSFVDELDIGDLHGVGWSIRNRCRDLFGTCNVGELKEKASKGKFVATFGEKHGATLWDKLYGKERDQLESTKPRQSCGASVNYAIRFTTQDEVRDFVRRLSAEVSSRLKAISMAGRICCISVMVRSKDAPVEAPKFLGHGICDTFNRSTPFARLTDNETAINANAWKMIAALHVAPDQFRGIGVSMQKLEYTDERGTAMKRAPGQSVLSFRTKENEQQQQGELKAAQSEDSRAKSEGKQDVLFSDPDDDGSFPPSPSLRAAATSFPSSTQFVVPSDADLDEDVLNALPESIRSKIVRTREMVLHQKKDASALLEDDKSAVVRAPSPALTDNIDGTPEKEQKRKLIDPFERMRAASRTPTKRIHAGKSRGTIASAPSTPSGSQQRRMHSGNRLEWEPTWSQVDLSVLEELPNDVRTDILRQMGRTNGEGGESSGSGSGRHHGTVAAQILLATKVGGNEMIRRSSSESPRKRQAHLDALGRMTVKQSLKKAIGDANAPLPPIAPLGLSKTTGATVKLDPTTVKSEELVALEIDPDVFVALPLSVQQETLDEMQERKARFRSGQHAVELTKAQQRVAQRKIALPDDSVEAKRLCVHRDVEQDKQTNVLPSIKGMNSADEVCTLLTAWVKQFEQSGPRERDVDRFARYLVECVQGVQTKNGQKLSEGPGPVDGLEKMYAVVRRWTRLVRQMDENQETNKQQVLAWRNALEGAYAQIDQAMVKRFGGRLSLHSL